MSVLAPSAGSSRLTLSRKPPSHGRINSDPDSAHQISVPIYQQELWTSRQRQASPIHEVSYRACFKPQLPAWFIERLTREDDVVYDPFSGRGTTAVEAALRRRRVIANDINPLSAILAQPRLEAPDISTIEKRIKSLRFSSRAESDMDLSMFFHRDTERDILNLRSYLDQRRREGAEDATDRWIRMVSTNRLTGHSPGFFSVYTLPPNQAASPENQIRINLKLGQQPTYRDIRALILKKTAQLLKKLSVSEIERLRHAAGSAVFLGCEAAQTSAIPSNTVQLTVTSPPFLDVVQYARDNWLRCWFNGLDAETIGSQITMSKTVEAWADAMSRVFDELYRITKPGGYVAFEVGEVRKGKVKLEETVAPLGLAAGFDCEAILINTQRFTKTANIWGVKNNNLGTNSNRIVLFRKPL